MRHIARILTPIFAIAAITLAGASSALAASPDGAASSNGAASTQDLAASWCFDDVVIQYCFDISGKARYVDNAGRSSVVVTERFRTVAYQDGVQVGESVVVSLDKFSMGADGSYTVQQVSHTKTRAGDERCSIQVVWRQSDFETVVDHWSGGCS